MLGFLKITYFFVNKKFLKSLTDSIKNHSNKEIERTHHLFAIDNLQSLYNNNNLSQSERNEILQRFKQYACLKSFHKILYWI